MASYSMSIEERTSPQKPVSIQYDDDQVSVIRREFVTLTGDHFSAVVLNQLLYWTLRVKDFDLYLEEERTQGEDPGSFQHGWIYKTAIELNEETMLGITHPTMRKYLKLLIDQGWIEERINSLDKWNKTTKYRINIKALQADLMVIGRQLPTVYLKAFASALGEKHSHKHQKAPSLKARQLAPKSEEISNVRILQSNVSDFHSDENINDPSVTFSPKSEETPNVRILHSDVKNLPSDVSYLQSSVSSFHSNVKNLHSYTYTENTTENTNKEHTQRTCAREADQKNVDLKKSKNRQDFESLTTLGVSEAPEVSEFSAPASLSQLLELALEPMAMAWKTHVGQEVHLTAERKKGLQSVLGTYFHNDLTQWQQFCERVGRSPFLMGQGTRRWRVSLDWVLCEENLLKVLEGNFDDPARLDQKTEKASENARKNEVNVVLASIEDSTWREWCSQLDFSPESREFVSLMELKSIANAKFLEVEDDRLVWVGSSDRQTLSRIEDLRFKLLSIIQRTFPHIRNLRTRLEETHPLHRLNEENPHALSTKAIQQKGENDAE